MFACSSTPGRAASVALARTNTQVRLDVLLDAIAHDVRVLPAAVDRALEVLLGELAYGGDAARSRDAGQGRSGGLKRPPETSLDVLHLLREIGREGAWMLGFRIRGLGRVHVWVHRKWGLELASVPHNRLCHEMAGVAGGTIDVGETVATNSPRYVFSR